MRFEPSAMWRHSRSNTEERVPFYRVTKVAMFRLNGWIEERHPHMKFETFWKESRVFAFCLVSAGVGAVIGSGGWAAHSPALAPVAAAAPSVAYRGSIEASFAPVVELALPAVVNISSSKARKVSA